MDKKNRVNWVSGTNRVVKNRRLHRFPSLICVWTWKIRLNTLNIPCIKWNLFVVFFPTWISKITTIWFRIENDIKSMSKEGWSVFNHLYSWTFSWQGTSKFSPAIISIEPFSAKLKNGSWKISNSVVKASSPAVFIARQVKFPVQSSVTSLTIRLWPPWRKNIPGFDSESKIFPLCSQMILGVGVPEVKQSNCAVSPTLWTLTRSKLGSTFA